MVHYDTDDLSVTSEEENILYYDFYNEFISINNNASYMSDEDYEKVYYYDNHSEEERLNGKLYIGSYVIILKHLAFQISVSIQTFYHFPFTIIQQYLSTPNPDIIPYVPVQIMKLEIIDKDFYTVILKTHWIRMIQRNWKRIYKERCKIIQIRKSPLCQHQYEITGKYLYEAQYLPSLRGMLHSLQ